jgi:DNA mismatch endonuclease (patch repair protein)
VKEPHAATAPSFVPPSPARSQNMTAVRRTNTKPETDLRRALHAKGLRFRKDYPIRLGRKLIRPDIAFTRLRIAVFVDGCFRHLCPEHGQIPATNVEFWTAKLRGNAERDRDQDSTLTSADWLVVRIWEHEQLPAAVASVESALNARRGE